MTDGESRWRLHRRTRCACGRGTAIEPYCGRGTPEATTAGAAEAPPPAILSTRRTLAGGGATLLAALSGLLPAALAQAKPGPLEKTRLTVGYVPITCTVPLLLADALGYYRDEGLDVSLVRTPGWALVRDKLLSGEFDASHLVLGVPFTMSLGIGSVPFPTRVAAVQNTNGDAIVLALRHRERRDPRQWKGLRFGIPHEHSVHAMLLRYYLAEHGLDPDRDVELRVYPPPDSVANMAAGSLDGMLFAEPWGQRAVFENVGFIHALSRDIFPDHPCCTLSVGDGFIKACPNSFAALLRAVVKAAAFADRHDNRQRVAELLAPARYLNQPRLVLEQVLLGRYADGLGKVVDQPDRIGFDTYPYASTGIWLLTQLRRWKIISHDVDYRGLTAEVFLSKRVAGTMADLGLRPPSTDMASRSIMGREFDPGRPAEYLEGFAIKRV